MTETFAVTCAASLDFTSLECLSSTLDATMTCGFCGDAATLAAWKFPVCLLKMTPPCSKGSQNE